MFALGRKSKTTLKSTKTRKPSTEVTADDYHQPDDSFLFKSFQLRSLTLGPQTPSIQTEKSFYNLKNINDNYTKPIRFHNVNRQQLVEAARTAFSEMSAKRSTRMPCHNGKNVHRRLPAQKTASQVFLTQGERSREPTSVSLRPPSPSPLNGSDDLEDEILEPVRAKLDVDDIKRRLYQKECTRVGVTPVGKFLRSPTQSEISIRYYNLGSGGAKALSVPLMVDSTMTKLDLEGNAIGDEGLANMAEMLVDHCSINEMNLNRNNLTSKSAPLLCKVLLQNRRIHSLSLSANNFDDTVGQIFANMLKENRDLRSLDLSENSLGDASGKALGDALSHNETLTSLDLAWNKFRGKGAAKLLEGVKENVGLKWLNLSFNSLSRGPNLSSPDAIGNALANNSTLKHIDLFNTQLHDVDMLGVAKGLKGNETLQSIKLGRNTVQMQSIGMVLKSVALNDCSNLTLLDLDDIGLEESSLNDVVTLRSRGVKVIHGPVHQTETNFKAKASSSQQKAEVDEEDQSGDNSSENTKETDDS